MDAPIIEDPAHNLTEIMDQPSHGEKLRVWAIITDPNLPPTQLPRWMKPGVDKRISEYIHTSEWWDKQIAERQAKGFDHLPPKLKKKWDAFISEPNRRLVLHKTKHTLVARPDKLDPEEMKKQCILIELGMDKDASKLTIRAGNGQAFKLALLEIEASVVSGVEAVPEVIDIPPPNIFVADCEQDAKVYMYICV